MAKTYCIECKYFLQRNRHLSLLPMFEECSHGNNKGSWRSKDDLVCEPWILNKNNDCKEFEKKEK